MTETTYETILVDARRARRHHHAEPAEGAQRAQQPGDGRSHHAPQPNSTTTRASARSSSPAAAKAFAAGADIKEMAEPVVRRRVRRRLLRRLGQVRRHAHPDHRRGRRLRARRRLRAGDDVRHADRRRHREVRSARDQARRAARHGRLAAADPRHRQGQGHGPDPDRTQHGRRGGRARGLVSRVVPADDLLDEAKAVATTISQMSLSASRMAKEAVNRAFESTLAEGLLYERRLFHSAFATDDQSEGMAAFIEKRAAELHPPLGAGAVRDRHRRRSGRPADATASRPRRQPAAKTEAVVGSALHLHRHRGRPDLHLVFDDAVAAAARPAVPGPGQRLRPAPSATALGVFAVWLVRYMRSKDSSPPAPRWAWLVLIPVGAVGMVLMAIWFHVWQDDVRDLMGVEHLNWYDYPLAAVAVAGRAVRVRRDRPADPPAGHLPGRPARSVRAVPRSRRPSW